MGQITSFGKKKSSFGAPRRGAAAKMNVIFPSGFAIVYGGNTLLGQACIAFFKARNWWIGSIDTKENEDADANVVVKPDSEWVELEAAVHFGVVQMLKKIELDAIFFLNDERYGDHAAKGDFVRSADLMWKRKVWPSVIVASLAEKFLKPSGLLVLSGTKMDPQRKFDAVGHQMAEAAVYQLLKNLTNPHSDGPPRFLAVGILLVNLETKTEKSRCDNNFLSLRFVSDVLYSWAAGQWCPQTGSLAVMSARHGENIMTIT